MAKTTSILLPEEDLVVGFRYQEFAVKTGIFHLLICTRHIFRELSQKLFWVTALLLLVFGSQRLMHFLGDAVAGSLPADMVFAVLGHKVVASLPGLLPALLMFAVLFSFMRMKRDRELMTMACVGLGVRYQINTVLKFSLIYAAMVLLFVAWLSPFAEQRLHDLFQALQQEATVSGFQAGHFRKIGADKVIHARRIAGQGANMEQVFLHEERSENHIILRAEEARAGRSDETGQSYVTFLNGRRYLFEPTHKRYQITRFQDYTVFLESGRDRARQAGWDAVPLPVLLGDKGPGPTAQRHWRYASVLSCLLLATFAVLITHVVSADRPAFTVLIAILVYAIYSNLLVIGTRLLQRQHVPLDVGLWWVHVLLLSVIVLLLYLGSFHTRQLSAP